MKHSLTIAIGLLSLTGLLMAQPPEEVGSHASVKTVASAIQTELEAHGERVMGKDVYHWSTRLEKFEDCRAEFSVRVTSNLADSTVHVESVKLSLGALDPYGIEMQQKHWLQLPCAGGQTCIFSTTTCSRKSANGIVTDCTTASQKRVDAFSLQFDGDADSAQRLEAAFRQAVESCRQPSRVTF
jgi:hypothetical protein